MCRFLRDPATPTESVPETHFFGVFDGHAGGKCSKAICTTIPYQFSRDEAYSSKVTVALKRAIQRTNEQFLEVAGRMRLNDGSTGVCVVLRGTTMTISNVGDSRACLISARKGITLTEDHKPSMPSEQRRIASFGGTVTYNTGIARVAGVLAVSRAFGNYGIRNLIRADPDITQRELVPEDDFLVLASDGLWDVFRANEVAEVCYTLQKQGVSRIADQLVQLALTRGSMDNITAVVVSLSKYVTRMRAAPFEEGNLKRAATISAVLGGVSGSGRYMAGEEGVAEAVFGKKSHSEDQDDSVDYIDDELTAVDETTFDMEYNSSQQTFRSTITRSSSGPQGSRKPPIHSTESKVDAGGSIANATYGSGSSGGLASRISRNGSGERSPGVGISGLFARQSRSNSQNIQATTSESAGGRTQLSDMRIHQSQSSDSYRSSSPSSSKRPITSQAHLAGNGSMHSPIFSQTSGSVRRPGSGASNEASSRLRFGSTDPVVAFAVGGEVDGTSVPERMHSPITTGAVANLGAAPNRHHRTRPSTSSNSKNSMIRSNSHY